MPRVFTLCSIVVHALVVAAALVAPLFAIDTLPAPRHPVTFDGIRRITLTDVPLPTPRRHATRASDGAVAMAPNAAPTVMPAGIAHETGRENDGTSPSAFEALGVEHGLGNAIEIGVVERMPPPPPVAAQAPVRVGSGIHAPRKIVDVKPLYPQLAQTARVEGVVILEAILDARGHVASVHVLRSVPLLDQAAVAAVEQWTYTPTLLNGVAVPVVMTVTVQFTLQGR
jgi:periplasmic protein TonB